MATTPQPTLVSSQQTIVQYNGFFSKWIKIIETHEKLILAVIIALVLWHYGDKAYDAYGKYLLSQQSATNTQIAKVEQQNALNAATLQQLTATVAAQAKIDDAKIAAAKQTIVVKQQQDELLPLPLLSARWESLVTLPPGSITPQPNGTVAVTTDAAHLTVNQLESIQPLTDQLTATQDQLKGCTTLSAQKDTTITGLQSDITLEKTGRAEDAKVAKVAITKAHRKGLKQGFALGFGTAVAAIVAIFH
jgi:hypothetical protein